MRFRFPEASKCGESVSLPGKAGQSRFCVGSLPQVSGFSKEDIQRRRLVDQLYALLDDHHMADLMIKRSPGAAQVYVACTAGSVNHWINRERPLLQRAGAVGIGVFRRGGLVVALATLAGNVLVADTTVVGRSVFKTCLEQLMDEGVSILGEDVSVSLKQVGAHDTRVADTRAVVQRVLQAGDTVWGDVNPTDTLQHFHLLFSETLFGELSEERSKIYHADYSLDCEDYGRKHLWEGTGLSEHRVTLVRNLALGAFTPCLMRAVQVLCEPNSPWRVEEATSVYTVARGITLKYTRIKLQSLGSSSASEHAAVEEISEDDSSDGGSVTNTTVSSPIEQPLPVDSSREAVAEVVLVAKQVGPERVEAALGGAEKGKELSEEARQKFGILREKITNAAVQGARLEAYFREVGTADCEEDYLNCTYTHRDCSTQTKDSDSCVTCKAREAAAALERRLAVKTTRLSWWQCVVHSTTDRLPRWTNATKMSSVPEQVWVGFEESEDDHLYPAFLRLRPARSHCHVCSEQHSVRDCKTAARLCLKYGSVAGWALGTRLCSYPLCTSPYWHCTRECPVLNAFCRRGCKRRGHTEELCGSRSEEALRSTYALYKKRGWAAQRRSLEWTFEGLGLGEADLVGVTFAGKRYIIPVSVARSGRLATIEYLDYEFEFCRD